MLENVKVTRDLLAELLGGRAEKRAADAESRQVRHLADLLEHMLALDPAKRIPLKDALHHPFFSDSPY